MEQESELVFQAEAVVRLAHSLGHELVVLKLYAGGLKSMSDIVKFLSMNGDADLDAIDALCERYRIRGFAKIRKELENR